MLQSMTQTLPLTAARLGRIVCLQAISCTIGRVCTLHGLVWTRKLPETKTQNTPHGLLVGILNFNTHLHRTQKVGQGQGLHRGSGMAPPCVRGGRARNTLARSVCVLWRGTPQTQRSTHQQTDLRALPMIVQRQTSALLRVPLLQHCCGGAAVAALLRGCRY